MDQIQSRFKYYIGQNAKLPDVCGWHKNDVFELAGFDLQEYKCKLKFSPEPLILEFRSFSIIYIKLLLYRLSDMTTDHAKAIIISGCLKDHQPIDIELIDEVGLPNDDFYGIEFSYKGKRHYIHFQYMNILMFEEAINLGYWMWEEEDFENGQLIDRKKFESENIVG